MTAMNYIFCVCMQTAFIEEQSSNSTIEMEFNVTEDHVNDTVAMCRIVAYYNLVEAVDNGSNIHYYLKQNALDAVAYLVSLLFLL